MYIDLSKLSDVFSSKLRVISFFLAIIKINKLKKKIFIYEKKTKDCPFLFTDLCLIKNHKIVKLNSRPKTNIHFTPYNYKTELKKLKKNYFINFEREKKFENYSKLLFKSFIPNKKIKKKIDKINLPKNFIGIHIRSTDREIKIQNFLSKIQFEDMIFDFHIDNMITNIISFKKSITNFNNVFISSDNKYYKEKLQKKLRNNLKIYFNNSKYKTKSFRQTNGEDFVTELFCLSKSKIIISTLGGAVPNTACLISKNSIKLYKWTNIINIFIFLKIFIYLIFNLKKIKSKTFKFIKLD